MVPVSERSTSGEECPIASGAGPRRARQLRTWTLVDDGETSKVTVPHTWNDEDAVDGEEGYERGEKRYQTEIRPAADPDGRRFLHFEGANQTAVVEIDGKRVARHEGGYTAFTVDVTEHVTTDETATVTVAVDNTHDPDIPPLDGDFTFYGGLYRSVWLVETAGIHVDATDHGSSGVFVDTPTVAQDRASVRVRTTIVNDRKDAVEATVTHRIVDEDDAVVATFGGTERVAPRGDHEFEAAATVDDPRLWNPDAPHCYMLKTAVAVEDETVDRIENRFGIRKIGIEDGQLVLNDDPIELRGTSRHQDLADRGNALSSDQHVADVERIAEMGANFLRLAHYPQSEAVLDAADGEGLLLWEEIPVINEVTDSESFVENSRRMVREMVRQHYNHPSVGIWGFMNELFIHTDADDEEAVAAVKEQATGLDGLLREEDPGRPTAMACHYDDAYEDAGLTEIPDVLGWNMYVGWYYETLDSIGTVIEDTFVTGPDQVEMVSEYGAGADVRLHTREPEAWDFTEEFQNQFHERHIAAFDEHPDLSGTVQWNAFDFSAPIRDDTIPDINQKGLTTYDRQPKATYHLYRAWLADEPTVCVATRNWHRRAGRGDAHPITVYSDLESVELSVNGRSVGEREPDEGYAADWDVSLSPGRNTVVAEGTTADGTTVEDRTTVRLVPFDLDESDALPEQGLAINVGSHREFVTDDRVWATGESYADADFGWGRVGGSTETSLSRVSGTDADPLYQHWVEGIEQYRLDLPAGEYSLELHFCELIHEDPGQRMFDVGVDGTTIVEELDPVDSVGVDEAFTVEAVVSVEDGELTLDFEGRAGEPLLNALLIKPV